MSNEYKAQDDFFWISNLPVRRKETEPEIKSFSYLLVRLILVWSAELSRWNIAAVYHLKETSIPSTPYKYNFKAHFTNPVNFAVIKARCRARFRIWHIRTLRNHKMNPDNSVQNYSMYSVQYMYFSSPCNLIKILEPLAQSFTYSVQETFPELHRQKFTHIQKIILC